MLFVISKIQPKKLLSRIILLYRIQLKPILWRKPIFFIYKKLGFKVLTRDDLLINSKKYCVQQFGLQELVIAKEPYTCYEIPKETKKTLRAFTITIDKPFVCKVANAKLIGPTANGFDEYGRIILETTTPFHSIDKHLEGSVSTRSLVLNRFSKSDTTQIDTACSLINAWSRNYWHWMIDCLTKLEGVEFYRNQTGIKPILIIDSNPSVWQLDSLKLLGYSPGDYIQWNNSSVKVKNLVISSFRRHYDKVHTIESPSASRWVRQRMLSNIPEDKSDQLSFSANIFISRRKAFMRRVINEHDVMESLSEFGFVDYVLEEMSFLDQVRLFSRAKIIVAPHGAGLTNIIFAQNLTIVELFGSSLPPCFANLSRGLGFQYGCLKCQAPHTGMRLQDSDMIVNIAELRNLIVKILGGRFASYICYHSHIQC